MLIAALWVKGASHDPVEMWRFPAVMVLAVVAFELTIVFLRRIQRDRGDAGAALLRQQRRGTLISTAVLAGTIALSAAVCAQGWYAVLAVLFAYVGFLFSRYVPQALFGRSGEPA